MDRKQISSLFLVLLFVSKVWAQQGFPNPQEGDYKVQNFTFESGESLKILTYITLL